MRMDKLTTKFQMSLSDAQSIALGGDNQFVEPVHVMLALLNQEGGTARPLLTQAGVNINQLRLQTMEALDRLPRVEGTPGDVHVSSDLNRLIRSDPSGNTQHDPAAPPRTTRCEWDAGH